jgi:taurine dioxygenase
MAVEVKDLTKYTGAEIYGVDLSKPQSEETKALLNKTLADRGMLVFHDQDLDALKFCEAMGVFGELMQQSALQFCLPDMPIVGFVSNRDKSNGVLITRGEQYHTDHSNYPEPPKATTLFAVEIPTHGGDTQFVNVQAAFEELPEAEKEKISSLMCRHVGESSHSPRKMAASVTGKKKSEALQPLVAINPDNGKPGLFLNTARMEDIPGLSDEEMKTLVAGLMAHATQAKYEYRHKWRKNDVVVWDNRSVLHQANGDVPPEQYRYLLRLMVKGQKLEPYKPAKIAA